MELESSDYIKRIDSLRQGSIQLLYTHRCQWTGCTDKDCWLCRHTRQRCFSYVCNSQVVKSNRTNDQNKAETCLLKADCGDCVAVTAISLSNADPSDSPMTHIQLSLIEESEGVKAIVDSQSQHVQTRQLVRNLMEHAVRTPDILKAHLTRGAVHQDGQLVLPVDSLEHGYGVQGREISALRINVYIDCLLKDIRNASDEPVKSVHLLAVAVYISKGDQKEVLDHVIPALSSPFTSSSDVQLFTRRRDIKSPFPWASDAVTEVSDIAEATARKLRNLRANAPVYETDMRAMLPNKPIETAGQLHSFLEPLDDEVLTQVSRLVLRRPADCLAKLKKHLAENMITNRADNTPRLWSRPANMGLGLLYPAHEGAVDLRFTDDNPKDLTILRRSDQIVQPQPFWSEYHIYAVVLHGKEIHPENEEPLRLTMHHQAVIDWSQEGHGMSWCRLSEAEALANPRGAMGSQFSEGLGAWHQEADTSSQSDNIMLPISSSYLLEAMPGHMSLDAHPLSQDLLHPYQSSRDWLAANDSFENPFQARDNVTAPMTDCFGPLVQRMADPEASGRPRNLAWQDSLQQTFNRSMRLEDADVVPALQSFPPPELSLIPLDSSLTNALQPMSWSLASSDLMETNSSTAPSVAPQASMPWFSASDAPISGGFQGVTISTSTPEELESPFKAFHYPGQPRQY